MTTHDIAISKMNRGLLCLVSVHDEHDISVFVSCISASLALAEVHVSTGGSLIPSDTLAVTLDLYQRCPRIRLSLCTMGNSFDNQLMRLKPMSCRVKFSSAATQVKAAENQFCGSGMSPFHVVFNILLNEF